MSRCIVICGIIEHYHIVIRGRVIGDGLLLAPSGRASFGCRSPGTGSRSSSGPSASTAATRGCRRCTTAGWSSAILSSLFFSWIALVIGMDKGTGLILPHTVELGVPAVRLGLEPLLPASGTLLGTLGEHG